MIANCLIKDVMSERLITIHPKDDLEKAKAIFRDFDIHHLPVTVIGKLVGILSVGDLLVHEWEAKNQNGPFFKNRVSNFCKIEQIMTHNPIFIGADQKVNEALDLIIKFRINALPVVENEKVVGILTSFDIIQYLQSKITQNASI